MQSLLTCKMQIPTGAFVWEWLVAPDAMDTSSGEFGQPLATIAGAQNGADAGDKNALSGRQAAGQAKTRQPHG